MLKHKIFKISAAAALMTGVAFTASGDIQPGYFGTTSALSSGKWVKIKVSSTGMQQITPEQLAEWGFADPSKVAVCGYGGAALYLDQVTDNVPDDVKPVPSLYDGSRLMFYGIADLHYTASRPTDNSRWSVTVRRNYYADHGCYFLTDAIDPVTPVNVPFRMQYNTQRDEAFSVLHVEQEEHNPELGARFFFGDLSDAKTHSIPLDLPGYCPLPDYLLTPGNANRSSMHVSGVLAYSVNSWGNSRWQITPGGSGNQTFNLQRRDKGECVYEAQQNSFVDNPAATDGDRYELNITLDNVGINYAALDFIDVTYRRHTDMARGGQQSFILESGNTADRILFSNASSRLAVWDITDYNSPYAYEVNYGDNNEARISLQTAVVAGRTALPTVVAFDPETDLYAVEKIGDVASQNLHALSTPDLVIVSAPGFMDQAERLAEIHRSKQGMDVLVVDHNLIYNEFSSGTPALTGTRRFLRMLNDREPGKLKAVLLLGGCSWDNRNLTNFPGAEEYFVPIYQDQSLVSGGYMSRSYATDAVYGMLSDDFSTVGLRGSRWSDNLAAQMEISVGRLPARDPEECSRMVDKVEAYMNNLPYGDTFSRVLISADRGTKNAFAQQGDEIAAIVMKHFPDAGITKGYSQFFYNTAGGNGNNTPEFLTRSLSRGTNFWYYTGHAAPTNIGSGDAPYWNTSDVNNTEYDVPPFVLFATCRSAYYDHGDNIITTMLKKKNGGIIGGIGALREVYLNNNHVFGKLATEAYFTSPANTLQGDVFRRARNKMAIQARNTDADSVNIVNTSCYNFIGDPAVPIFLPGEKIKVSSVNGVTSGKAVVTPLTSFNITGTVGPDGSASDTFNGEIMIAIYDAPQPLVAYDKYDNIDYYLNTTLDNDIIYSRCAEVKNGRFDVSVILPVPARPGVSNRVVLYANTPDGGRRAVGSYDDLVINPVDGFADGSSFAAPVIEAMYLDAPTFTDGDLVSSTPTLYAEIGADEAGLVGDSPIFGQGLAIILDDSKTSYNAGGLLKHMPDGSATLAYPMSDLSDGPHSLTLRISNNAGQSSTRTINFTVVNTPLTASLSVDEAPATTVATINLEHFYNDLTDTRLIITDMAGNAVFADPAATFPYRWNLKGHDGKLVPPGRYRIDVKLHSGLKYGAAVQGELIVAD